MCLWWIVFDKLLMGYYDEGDREIIMKRERERGRRHRSETKWVHRNLCVFPEKFFLRMIWHWHIPCAHFECRNHKTICVNIFNGRMSTERICISVNIVYIWLTFYSRRNHHVFILRHTDRAPDRPTDLNSPIDSDWEKKKENWFRSHGITCVYVCIDRLKWSYRYSLYDSNNLIRYNCTRPECAKINK